MKILHGKIKSLKDGSNDKAWEKRAGCLFRFMNQV
jgi:hypothetical protein